MGGIATVKKKLWLSPEGDDVDPILEHRASVIKKQKIREIVKKAGLCIYCVKQSGGKLNVGENARYGKRTDVKNWKRKRKTKYKEKS